MIGVLALGAIALAGPSDACVDCHRSVAEDHDRSRHASAFDGPLFQAAWRRWPERWCLDCHAPGPEQQEQIGPGVATLPPGRRVGAHAVGLEGVGCVACHVREDGVVLTARPPGALAESLHPMAWAPDLGTTTCLTCHQFTGPEGGAAVQDTGEEHRRSGVPLSCADCHMPEGRHTFPGAHDAHFVRASLTAEARAVEGGVEVKLQAHRVGHRVPTGDPFRRLEVMLCADPTCDEVQARTVLQRRVGGVGSAFAVAFDRRMPVPDATGRSERVVSLPGEGRWWRVYFGLADPEHDELPSEAQGYVVAEGPVPGR